MLDWDDLRTFLAISRHGTVSAAARVLKVSQTTMGRRLDHLHDRAGATLLKRTPTGFQLTPTGAAILGEVERYHTQGLLPFRSPSDVPGGKRRQVFKHPMPLYLEKPQVIRNDRNDVSLIR